MTQLSVLDHVQHVTYLAQQGPGPEGSEFGKASPVGWLVLALLMAIILYLGWAFTRRYSRLHRRRMFAEEHGLDVFDEQAVDEAMAAAGVLDQRKKHWL